MHVSSDISKEMAVVSILYCPKDFFQIFTLPSSPITPLAAGSPWSLSEKRMSSWNSHRFPSREHLKLLPLVTGLHYWLQLQFHPAHAPSASLYPIKVVVFFPKNMNLDVNVIETGITAPVHCRLTTCWYFTPDRITNVGYLFNSKGAR